jgi:hypothetical protein
VKRAVGKIEWGSGKGSARLGWSYHFKEGRLLRRCPLSKTSRRQGHLLGEGILGQRWECPWLKTVEVGVARVEH